MAEETISVGAKAPRKFSTTKRIYQDAGILMDDFEGYVRWARNNPLYRNELVKFQGDATIVAVPLTRPLGVESFAIFAGVSHAYFVTAKRELKGKIEDGKASEAEKQIVEAIEVIECVCRTQQVDNALVGNYAPNLVARLNGISDNTNVNNTGDATIKVTVRDEKTAKNINALEDIL